MTSKNQVSPVIRISQENRDASARATHLEAANRKFLLTTNERKQMSTKTNFKRVALVAVAALGLGVLSSVPSQATVTGTPTVTVGNGSATLTKSDSTTAASLNIRYYATAATDTAAVTVTLGIKPTAAVGGTDSILASFLDSSTATGVTTVNKGAGGTGFTFGTESKTVSTVPVIVPTANSFANAKIGFHLDTALVRTAGTYTANYLIQFYEAGTGLNSTKTLAGTFDIVVSDGTLAAAGAVAAAGTSTAVMTKQGTGEGTDETDLRAVFTPTGAAIANIVITAKTSAGLPAQESVTVTTTKGNLADASTLAGSTVSGKTLTLVGGTNGVNTVYLFADGTSGVATISVKTTSVTFSNKSATFYGTTVAKIVAVKLGNTLGATASNAIAAKAYDSDGNQITSNDAVYAYSSDLTVVNTGATTGSACSYVASVLAQICSLTGATDGKANITLRNKSTVALSTVASDPVSVTVNTKSPATVKIAFDKASYAPGEVAYVRVWALDASGNPVAPGSKTALLATGGITSSASFGNGTITESLTVNTVSPTLDFTTAAARGYASTEPIYLAKVFMPSTGGTVTLTATGGTLLPASGQVAVTATATVADSGSAALAAVTALATTVASLKTLIVTLTNLVLKIQKKVKA